MGPRRFYNEIFSLFTVKFKKLGFNVSLKGSSLKYFLFFVFTLKAYD